MLLKVVLFFFTNGKHQLHKLSDTHPQTHTRTHTPRSVREQQGFKFISICLEFQTFIGKIHIHVNPVCPLSSRLSLEEYQLIERSSIDIAYDLEDISCLGVSDSIFNPSVHKALK